MIVLIILSIACALNSALHISAPAAQDRQAPVTIEVGVISPFSEDNRRKVYVTLGNESQSIISSIRVSIETEHERSPAQTLAALNMHQWQTVSFSLRNGQEKYVIVTVEYKLQGDSNSITKVVRMSEDVLAQNDLFRFLLPAVVGVFGALAGAGLTAKLSNRRELARMKYEWSKALFQLYEPQYRQFTRRLAGTIDPGQVRLLFEQLEDSALLKPQIRSELEKTLHVLESQVDKDKKISARDAFLDQFLELLVDANAKRTS